MGKRSFHNFGLQIIFYLPFTILLFFNCSKENKSENTIVIVKIIDGDTFQVLFNGKKESVRLIGIDTPETRRNRKAKKDAERTNEDLEAIIEMGKSSKKFLQSLIKEGDTITLEFDVQERDRYGRLLAYAYLDDGRMINEIVIRNGFASPMTIPPNIKYEDIFLESYRYARENNLGLW